MPLVIHEQLLHAESDAGGESGFSRMGALIAWALISAVLIVWALALLSYPFGRDQGILAWAGDVVLHGGMPYRNAWEVKGPSAILPFTIMEFVTGRNMWGIRLFELLLLCGAATAAAYAARIWFDKNASVYAVFLLLFIVSSLDFWTTAQPDGWCGYALIGVIALLANANLANARHNSELLTRRSPGQLLAAAALIGCCTLQKPIYGIFLLLFAPELIARWRIGKKLPWRECLAVAAGFLSLIGVVLLWLASRGAIVPFVNVYIRFNLAVHAQADPMTPAAQFRSFLDYMRTNLPFSVGMPLAVVGGVLLARRSRIAGATYSLWLGLTFVLVILQRKYLHYQWYPAMCAVGFGAAIAISALRNIRFSPLPSGRWSFSAGTVVFLWLAFVFLPTPALHGLNWVLFAIGRTPKSTYYDQFTFVSDNYYSFAALRDMANYVHAKSGPADTFEVWGWDPLLNYLSDRSAPSRFGYNYPLINGGVFRDRYRNEFMNAVRKRPPVFVAVALKDNNQLVRESSADALKGFTELDHFLEARYRPDKVFGAWQLWRLVT